MRSSVVLFTTTPEYWSNGKPIHHYNGCISSKIFVYFIKEFKNGKISVTLNKKEAMHFTNDGECTRCMERILAKNNPWTIAVWNYKNKDMVAQCVHYPNEHWSNNNNLQPSLMHTSVSEFWLRKGDK